MVTPHRRRYQPLDCNVIVTIFLDGAVDNAELVLSARRAVVTGLAAAPNEFVASCTSEGATEMAELSTALELECVARMDAGALGRSETTRF